MRFIRLFGRKSVPCFLGITDKFEPKATDVKTVIIVATAVAALAGAGRSALAQEVYESIAAPQKMSGHAYDYSGHPGVYDPKGPVLGHSGGFPAAGAFVAP